MKLDEFLKQFDKPARPADLQKDRFDAEIRETLTRFGDLSLDDLNVEIGKVVERSNNAGRPEFAGMSSDDMHTLLRFPLSANSPVRLKKSISNQTLNEIGFFRLAEEFLKIVERDGSIKLTKAGYLPRRLVLELHNFHFVAEWIFDEDILRLRREEDSRVISSLHAVVALGGLVRKIHGKLFLTKKGEKLLAPTARAELLRIVIQSFMLEFNWAYNDGYPDFTLCADASGFTLYVLGKHGNVQRPKDFYAEKFLEAFPMARDEFMRFDKAQKAFLNCYKIRTFSRFLEWFNFVDGSGGDKFGRNESSLVKKSKILDAVFAF